VELRDKEELAEYAKVAPIINDYAKAKEHYDRLKKEYSPLIKQEQLF